MSYRDPHRCVGSTRGGRKVTVRDCYSNSRNTTRVYPAGCPTRNRSFLAISGDTNSVGRPSNGNLYPADPVCASQISSELTFARLPLSSLLEALIHGLFQPRSVPLLLPRLLLLFSDLLIRVYFVLLSFWFRMIWLWYSQFSCCLSDLGVEGKWI